MEKKPDQTQERPLLSAFPELAVKLPLVQLVTAPSPVEPLTEISRFLGAEVWIKRDDLTSRIYGGNKTRKLEFILGRARESGKKMLVTCGGLGTHHGLATTVHGISAGFRVVVLLFDQPLTRAVQRNLLLLKAYQAEMVHCGSKIRTMFDYFVKFRRRFPQAFFIPTGGSSPLGCLGYINAGLELARQITEDCLPQPKAVYLPAGTGGTMVGLRLGLLLAGLNLPVIGIRVTPFYAVNTWSALVLARRIVRFLKGLDARTPRIKINFTDFRIVGSQYGPGYGRSTRAGRIAAELMAQAEGITLDPVYTAKTMAAIMNLTRSGQSNGPILYWHTHSSSEVTAGIKSTDWQRLPEPFHKYFDPPVEDYE